MRAVISSGSPKERAGRPVRDDSACVKRSAGPPLVLSLSEGQLLPLVVKLTTSERRGAADR